MSNNDNVQEFAGVFGKKAEAPMRLTKGAGSSKPLNMWRQVSQQKATIRELAWSLSLHPSTVSALPGHLASTDLLRLILQCVSTSFLPILVTRRASKVFL
jgi:hypothetical protein